MLSLIPEGEPVPQILKCIKMREYWRLRKPGAGCGEMVSLFLFRLSHVPRDDTTCTCIITFTCRSITVAHF